MFLNRKDIDMERFTQNFRLSRSEREREKRSNRERIEDVSEQLQLCIIATIIQGSALLQTYTMKLKLDRWVNIKIPALKITNCIGNIGVCRYAWCERYSDMVDAANILKWWMWQIFSYGGYDKIDKYEYSYNMVVWLNNILIIWLIWQTNIIIRCDK